MTAINVSRRAVLLGFGAGSLVLASGMPAWAEEEKKYGGAGMEHGLRDDPGLFLSIGENGGITLQCIRAEMGQGIRTSFAMVIADELDADLSQFTVLQAPADEEKFGNQNTDGSRSMRQHFATLRHIGASARQMLEEEAADRWKVPVAEVHADNHQVTHAASKRSLGYGELAKGAASRPVPKSPTLKPPGKFRYIGKSDIKLVDGADITVGKARYGIDARPEGVLHAVVARPPALGTKVKSFDPAEAMKVQGVIKVVQIDASPFPVHFEPLGGVAVVAENTFAAIKGRSKLKIEWEDGPNAHYDSASYRKELEAAARLPGKVVRKNGDVEAALKSAARKIEAEYYIPHLAHATMEPPSGTAKVGADGIEVWCSTQAPQEAKDMLAKRFGLPPDKVVVHNLLLGGGFGRKSKPDFVAEAAILSKAMEGKPVKVTFTREDDLHHSFFHTVSVERFEAGLDAKGKTVAWLHRTVAPSLGALFFPDPKHEIPPELGMGAVDMPMNIPNVQVENPESAAAAHTRIGWFRSVSNIPHAFAIQSFIAELAHAAGKDHKDYLLDLLGPDRVIEQSYFSDGWNYGEDPKLYPYETARLRKVIEAAAKGANWGRKLPKGHGLGIAAHRSFVSYTAVAVEVAVGDKGEIKIPRVDIAFDCGAMVNPDRVNSQMQGAVIQGLSLALTGEISFKDGVVQQSNYDDYEVLRIDGAPPVIEVHLVPSKGYDQPLGGVGEPGLPPVAPALTNAIFAATGKRIRSLPIRSQLA